MLIYEKTKTGWIKMKFYRIAFNPLDLNQTDSCLLLIYRRVDKFIPYANKHMMIQRPSCSKATLVTKLAGKPFWDCVDVLLPLACKFMLVVILYWNQQLLFDSY